MGWLQSIDVSLFHFINASLGNGLFDRLMPFLSDSPWINAGFAVAMALLICRGGARGRVCALMLLLTLFLGNALICNSIKIAVARPRPFQVLPNVIVRIGKGGSFAMPSSHAANWFSMAMVFFIYYRRTLWFMLPLALAVGFSRVYNGVHYPSDVLAGAILGAGYAVAIIWMIDMLWQWAGPRWFPVWKKELPSLAHPVVIPTPPDTTPNPRDAQWLRLGYLLIAILLFVRLGFLASGRVELSEDEAYQWLWSKHPALSYYSKPPLIAYTQFAGTHLWGDNEFGVRFFSPVITAILSLLVLRFMTRQAGARSAFLLLLTLYACPLLALGSVVMTVDPLSVLFWMAALLAGWRAVAPNGATRDWLWTGLWLGLGFLSKYTNLFQFVCWAVFFLLWPAARAHLRRPGPWLATLLVLLCSTPVLIWNSQHGWITVAHVASDGKLGQSTDRSHVLEFILGEAGLLNPVFFIGMIWAALAFWQGGRRDPLQLYLFSMGAPLVLVFFILSFHTRVEYNWIVPAVVPLFCLMTLYWTAHWKTSESSLRRCLAFGLGTGIFAVVMAHDPPLIDKLIHRQLPARADVMRRVSGWKETAQIVAQLRANSGRGANLPFIICDHYGITGLLSFYMPEAKSRVNNDPLVFYRATTAPDTQFYYWPNYLGHTGQNALFVRQADLPQLRPDWFWRWWRRDPDLYRDEAPANHPLPPELLQEFTSITNLGVKDVRVGGQIVRRIEVFACDNLRPAQAPASRSP